MDPKTFFEAATTAVKTVRLIERTIELLPKSGSHKQRRKVDWNLHHSKDRRISGVNLRLQTGIWLHFHYLTGYGKFEALNDAPESLSNLLKEAFVKEGVNYQIFGRDSADTLLAPSMIAQPAAEFAVNNWLEFSKNKTASALTDECAEYILSKYNVVMLDRRHRPKQESPLSKIGGLIESVKGSCGIYPKRRKEDWDPAHYGDRRKSGIASRLEHGIWLQFHRKTGFGMNQPLDRPQSKSLMHALVTECEHYEFGTRETPEQAIEASLFAEPAVASAWAKWKELPVEKRKACIITYHMAEYVLSHFNVRMIDRRSKRQHALAG
jgi:hypothetical protein